jgi:hypothetical protein
VFEDHIDQDIVFNIVIFPAPIIGLAEEERFRILPDEGAQSLPLGRAHAYQRSLLQNRVSASGVQ